MLCNLDKYLSIKQNCFNLKYENNQVNCECYSTMPWNLHEPYKDVYDFGDGHFEMSLFLDIVKFTNIAKEEDLVVILSLGPFINADLDFGGLPR